MSDVLIAATGVVFLHGKCISSCRMMGIERLLG